MVVSWWPIVTKLNHQSLRVNFQICLLFSSRNLGKMNPIWWAYFFKWVASTLRQIVFSIFWQPWIPSRKQGTRRNLPTPSESKRWNDTLKRKSGFKGTWKLPPANRASSDCFFCWWVIWGENPKSAICHYVSGCKKMVVSELLQAMNYVSNQDFKYNKFTKSLE